MVHEEAVPDQLVLPSAQEWRQGAERALQASGCRTTLSRRTILDWIAQIQTPFTAETLVADLEQRGCASRPTIYRTIEWLRSAGWIARVQCDVDHHTYARHLPGHYHQVICTACGITQVISGCAIEQLLVPALSGADFEIHCHRLEIYGICGICRATRAVR
jgi:Fe2+ or Zn2+ uptake regulation protein